jgi:peroxiredoxin
MIMKKGLFALFLLTISFAANFAGTQEDRYDIKIKISNVKDSVIYLGYHFGDQKYVKDTATIVNDVGHFTGDEALASGIYFVYSPSVYFELIINEPKISIETDTADFIANMKVLVSDENKIFNKFQKYMADRQRASAKICEEIGQLDKSKDSVKVRELRENAMKIRDEIEDYQANIISSHQGMFVSKMLNAMQKPVVPDRPKNENGEEDPNFRFYYYRNHFFDNFDLADPGLLRTPLYQPKIDEYIDKLTYQHPDSICKTLDFLLSKSESNQETFRYVLVKLTNKYETSNIMGMDRIFVYLAENYYLTGKAFWADDDLVDKFETRVKELKPTLIGNQAPEINVLDTLMRPVKLSQVNSRFVVLYFYDPDCGHCKKTTPVLSNLYHRIKNKGVEVFAACTVTDINKWKNYIKKNSLDWINVADPYYRSNFRADYDIKSTPQIFILDKNKEIIAKKLGVEQIEDFINRVIDFEDNKS